MTSGRTRRSARLTPGHRPGKTLVLSLALTSGCLALPASSAATLVGRVAGEFGVSATGAAGYTVPLAVAGGMNDLKPDIALVYDSQSGDGLAGMHWRLAGFSTISRCGLTRAVDGRFQSVMWGTEDRYCLDGQPLILLSGVYGSSGAEYRAEVHGFQKITSHGTFAGAPSYFKVQQPNGLTYWYGNTADSRVAAANVDPALDGRVRVWALNAIEDKYQNRIEFVYASPVAGEHLPSEVTWTKRGSQTAPYRLSFHYTARPPADQRSGYVWGSQWRTTQRLDHIDYEFNGERVHRYALSYTTGTTQRSQLDTISQCGAVDTDCLPVTDITWQNLQAAGFGTEQAGPTTPEHASGVPGDFDGNGTTDLFVPVTVGGTKFWHLAAGDPATGRLDSTPDQMPWPVHGTLAAHRLDYNGDGRADLLAEGQGGTWHVYVYEFWDWPQCPDGNCDTGIAVAQNPYVLPLDVNGDGLSDLLSLRGTSVYLRINSGTGFGSEQATSLPVGSDGSFYRALRGVTDVDGDGREDLVIKSMYSDEWPQTPDFALITVARSHWNTAVSPPRDDFTGIGTGIYTTSLSDTPVPLDINGDGLTDLAYGGSGGWSSVLSQGSQLSGATPAGFGASTVTPGDIDGDGRDDLLAPCAGGGSWCAYLSDGNGFSATRYTDLGGPAPGQVAARHLVDTDGDGYLDLLVVKSAGAPDQWRTRRHYGPRSDLVTGITDGLGNFVQPVYRPLTGWNGYTADAAAPPGQQSLRGGAFHVVSQYTGNTGVDGATYTMSYVYRNARRDMSGRGFLGFDVVTATDSRSDPDLVTSTNYHLAFPFVGRAEQAIGCTGTTLCTAATPAKVSLYAATWDKISGSGVADANHSAGAYHFPRLMGDVLQTYEVDTAGSSAGVLVRTVSRSFENWNAGHGVAATESVTVTSPADTGTHRTVTALQLNDTMRSNGSWCLGLPDRVDVAKDISSGPASTRTVQYTYDETRCRTLTEAVGPAADLGQQLKTSYTYNATNGRLVTVSQNAANGSAGSARNRSITYDAVTGFRPATESRTVSGESSAHVTAFSWNHGLGLMASRTTAQQQTTSWTHDAFGRLIAEARPVGGTTITYSDCPCAWTPAGARYRVYTVDDATGFWSDSYHDSYGREVGRRFELADGSQSRQATAYDASGRVASVTVPYLSGATQFPIAYSYDLLGRPKSETRPAAESDPDGAITSWTYNGLTTTVVDAEGRSTDYVTDADGRLTKVDAPLNGDAAYGYTPWGELSSIEDANSHTTTMSFDARGFRTQLTSPDAGTRAFVYNVFGELEKMRDAKTAAPTWTLTSTYDQLGRLKQRVDLGEGTTTWTYFTATGASKGLLDKVTSPGGFTESHIYDDKARVTQTRTTLSGAPGSPYATDYSYSAAHGRLETMTYPPTVAGQRPRFDYFYSNGYLNRIEQLQGGTGRRYEVTNQDALGRVTHARLEGGTLDVEHDYDRASGRLTAIRATDTAASDLQNYRYAWDRLGNLRQRRDLNQPGPLTEDFDYDALNRVTSARRNSLQTLSLSYAADGNLAWKSDAGSYGYNAARPHAVSSVTVAVSDCEVNSWNYSYDASGNLTSRAFNGVPNRWLTWTPYDLPKQVSAGASNCGGDCATLTYGPNRQLVKQVVKTGGATRTIWYVGPHFEVEVGGGVTQYRAHALAGGQVVYTQIEDTGTTGWQAYYPLRDHLGSVDRQVRAIGGGPDLRTYSYDAFGKRRNANWTPDPTDSLLVANAWNHRGFTDHEHLDNVRLIHMKGRAQDPVLGRMLSPDPVLGDLRNPQTLNPYSYVANNPLAYVDPDGLFLSKVFKFIRRAIRSVGSFGRRLIRNWGREIVAAVAAYYTAGAVSNWVMTSAMESVAVAGTGAAALSTLGPAATQGYILGAAAGGAVAGAIAGGDLQSAVTGAVTGGAFGGLAVAFGGEYSFGRVLAEGTLGGASATAQGGEFWQGFGLSAGTATAQYAYQGIVNYAAEWGPGGPAQGKSRYQYPIDGANNFGPTRLVIDPRSWGGEGGRFSRFMNQVPGMNAIAGMHDVFQVELDLLGGNRYGGFLRSALNYPGQPVAAALTSPALLEGVPAVMIAVEDD